MNKPSLILEWTPMGWLRVRHTGEGKLAFAAIPQSETVVYDTIRDTYRVLEPGEELPAQRVTSQKPSLISRLRSFIKWDSA